MKQVLEKVLKWSCCTMIFSSLSSIEHDEFRIATAFVEQQQGTFVTRALPPDNVDHTKHVCQMRFH